MSCVQGPGTFRLLDVYVGWDQASAQGLTGMTDPEGVRLALSAARAVDPQAVAHYLPPPALARGCSPCEWYLATPYPPRSRLLFRGPCTAGWVPLWGGPCAEDPLRSAVAMAARRHRIAVSDAGVGRVWIWARGGERLAAEIPLSDPGPLAFTPWGELLVTQTGSPVVRRFDPAGGAQGVLAAPLPGAVDRIAVSQDCILWLVVKGAGHLSLWRADLSAARFEPATLAELAASFPPTGIAVVSDLGFCLEETGASGRPVTSCYSWQGRCLDPSDVKPLPAPQRERLGQLLTDALDSGIPRCRWHRVRVDADVPPGTTVAVAIASSEEARPARQGDPAADPRWQAFDAGLPHPDDWHKGATGSMDFLVDQPHGRYLFLRLRLTGDGVSTPVVRRIRLDFPRITSLDFLPTVYRDNADAEDFTERFLSLFDAEILDLDRAIERYPALLDSRGVPDEALPWLASFLDLIFDRAWGPAQRRAVLQALPVLYRRRGTVSGLKQAIELVFGVEPAIEELASGRSWGAVGRRGRLGGVRLFSRSRARFHLGTSPLRGVPLRSFGNPDLDPLQAEAWRFRVMVPPTGPYGRIDPTRLARLVDAQKPAHTIAVSIRTGASGFVLGGEMAVGVDSFFGSLDPPVLGKEGNVRLGRRSVLWHGGRGATTGMRVARAATVGVSTVME